MKSTTCFLEIGSRTKCKKAGEIFNDKQDQHKCVPEKFSFYQDKRKSHDRNLKLKPHNLGKRNDPNCHVNSFNIKRKRFYPFSVSSFLPSKNLDYTYNSTRSNPKKPFFNS